MSSVLSRDLRLADFEPWYRRNRERTAQLFATIDESAYYSRPIPLRNPIAFYEGHLPAFSFITLVRDTLHEPSIDARLERLFQRGIDPADEAEATSKAQSAWPSRDEILAFGRACDARVEAALRSAQSADPKSREVQAAYTILEHEPMHHETFLYMLHRAPLEQKTAPSGTPRPADGSIPDHEQVLVPAGTATIGAVRSEVPFGWDNEFNATRVEVPAFLIDRHSVTNADYLAFVKAGGPAPQFWVEGPGGWQQRCMFEEIPLPLAWPVYVSKDLAEAYAAWRGARLPMEAEYHRAAYGTPDGVERPQPWGDAAPTEDRGNFDFARFDPVAAGSYPAGASAWGVHDLVGNGWEWTSTEFGPLPGFAPMVTYPPYSSDFFDGQHFVVKGASAVTARELIRRSLRNWYRPNYPYVYAKFRCVTAT